MRKQWISAPAPRTGRAAWTVAGSVLLHGAIIAVAALWPTTYAAPPEEPPPTWIFNQGDAAPPVVPDSNPSPPTTPNEPPPLIDEPPAVDAPPVMDEPSMELATPRPVPRTVENRVHPSRPAPPGSPSRSAQAASGGTVGAGRAGSAAGHWNTPHPPYPAALRLARVAGSGSVRIATDGAGRVVSANVVRSTGNPLLDENTCHFALANWNGPPNAAVLVPITYQLR